MLAKNSHIQQSDLIFSELLDNSFFFPQNKKILAYLKHKQSYDFFSWTLLKTSWAFLQT